jgi:hypothetical protein
MPVTGPLGPGAQLGAAGLPPSQALKSLLTAAGLLSGGADPSAVAKSIINNLKAQGYVPRSAGETLDNQLRQALFAFQKANGLKTSGAFDKATLSMLKNLKVLTPNLRASAGVVNVKDGFERAMMPAPSAKAAGQELSLAQNLRNLLEARFGAPGRALGDALVAVAEAGARLGGFFSSLGEGALNSVNNLVTGAGARAEAEAQAQAQVQGRTEGNPANVTAHGLVPTSAKTDDRGRAQAAFARKQAKARGVESGDPLAAEGVGDESGNRGFLGGGEGEQGAPEQGEDGDGIAVGAIEDEATERFTGNAASGDEKFADPSRGHATLDDGTAAPEGHYRVPLISEQIRLSFAAIRKDPSLPNQPTTYSWDVHIYRPAIYGPQQKAEELLHLEVRSADAFDPVWEKSLQALARHLKRTEPDAAAPELVDIQVALRQARVREQG